MRGMPPAEVAIDEELVGGLLRLQAPQFAGLPLRRVGTHGWDNTVFRLGDDLAVRLPRRHQAAALMEHEIRWLPEIAGRVPLPVPVPVFAGDPALGYPWRWAVCRWVPGEPIGTSDVTSVAPLARFLGALHRPASADAPANPWRGVPLAQRDARLRQGCALLVGYGLDPAGIERAWEAALAAPAYGGPPVWLHGDLHPANVLQVRGSVSGVIDFGDLTAGDPACDYLIGWLLPRQQRAALREAAQQHGAGTWDRARGWALVWGVAVLAASADNPLLQAIGRRAVIAAVERGSGAG